MVRNLLQKDPSKDFLIVKDTEDKGLCVIRKSYYCEETGTFAFPTNYHTNSKLTQIIADNIVPRPERPRFKAHTIYSENGEHHAFSNFYTI